MTGPGLPVAEARFPSRCAFCDGTIEEGDRIVRVEDEWAHVGCAEDEGIDIAE